MNVRTIEFSHGPVSIYAHSFESEKITKYIKEFLNTFKQFRNVTHELSPGIGRVTICSTNSSVIPYEFSDLSFGTLHLHFSTGRAVIADDVILSLIRKPERTVAIDRLINEIRSLIQLNEPEFVSA